ncbi:MAG: tetratricopeptide repeat protein [Desulfocapsa sp.]|nr:tetratricopeptide repeat protein [Desulfocapsa sp.]
MATTNIYQQGQRAFLGGDIERSIEAFSDALEQGIHPYHSHLNRGIAYMKICQLSRAVEDFDRILNKDPTHGRAFFYRGIARLNLGNYEAAIDDFDHSIALNPEKGASYLARGLAHHILGHRVEAEKDIHDNHVLNGIEPGAFMEEHILSESLFNKTLTYFEKDDAAWNLSLTENEVLRMGVVH